MFMGEYSHSIDAKGRLIMPAKFREQLGSEFVVTQGFDNCLFIYSTDEWQVFVDKFKELPMNRKETRTIMRFFFGKANTVEPDKQGRILLPGALRDYAGLQKDVTLVGVLNHIEIWDRKRWEDDSDYDNMDAIAEHMADLGLAL